MMAEEKLSGQFDAWVRQGAKDLHNAIVPAFPGSVRSTDELGTPLNPTQSMVTHDLGEDSYREFQTQRKAEAQEKEPSERGIER